MSFRLRPMRRDNTVLRGLLVGTVVTTLLLVAEGGGAPLREAAWILVGVTATMVTDAYASHVSSHNKTGLRGYVAGLVRNVAHEWSMVVACLPTVLLLMLAAMFGWHDDRENPDGSVTIGYTTIGGNLNVGLLFIWGAIAAWRNRVSLPWAVLFGFANAALGLLIVTVELALK